MADENRIIRLITFRVGPESFVLDIMAVRQIVPYTGSTPLPKAPKIIEGIIVLRNEVIPVIDLRTQLYPDLPAADRSPLVLITYTSAGKIGLKVDEVRKLVNIEVGSILPPPPLVRELQGDLFIGVVPHEDEVLLLLDLQTILTPEELREVKAAAEEHEQSQASS